MLNRVCLVGRMTRDPELRKTGSGMSVASFTIAVDDSYKGPNGEKTTLFMSCSIFGNKAENVVKYTRKGSLVSVEGRLSQRKYVRRNDNAEVTVIETIADNVEFLEPKSATQASAAEAGYTNQVAAAPQANNVDSIDVTDEDLPF